MISASNGTIPLIILIAGPCLCMVWGPERGGDQCEAAIRETIRADRATAVDDTSSRLHTTWLSQGCETRAGPEYVIRKYTFFGNGTFLLLRHHYAEESCSVATHTVTARGILRLLSSSILTPGATEARFQLDTVHVIPLNRQVAHKLGHRVNSSCSPQPRWRPYVPQLVYEQPPHRLANPLWEGPRYNSLQGHPPSRHHRRLDCLQPLGMEFGELRLLRVQRKPSSSKGFGLGSNSRPKVELLLGSLTPNVQTRWTHRPTGLQATPLLRIDTTTGCPMCSAIARGTETSPPVLHEVAALPALLGGSWVSGGCESIEGGLWIKRRLQVWPGDKLWKGRWDHYAGPKCSTLVYAITAAGSYVQRAGRQRRHQEERNTSFDENFQLEDVGSSSAEKTLPEYAVENRGANRYQDKELRQEKGTRRTKRNPDDDDDSYRHLLQNAQPSMVESLTAMLRGNQRYEETSRRPLPPPTPTGTTELDLHVAESLLIPGDATLATRCGGNGSLGPLTMWPRNCIPHAVEAPSTLGLRARVGVNWSGQYTLLLGPRDDCLWEAPLYQCGPTSSHNPGLRAHLRRSVGLRYGLISSSASSSRSDSTYFAVQFFFYASFYLLQ